MKEIDNCITIQFNFTHPYSIRAMPAHHRCSCAFSRSLKILSVWVCWSSLSFASLFFSSTFFSSASSSLSSILLRFFFFSFLHTFVFALLSFHVGVPVLLHPFEALRFSISLYFFLCASISSCCVFSFFSISPQALTFSSYSFLCASISSRCLSEISLPSSLGAMLLSFFYDDSYSHFDALIDAR